MSGIAVITGASRGIGAAVLDRLTEAGYECVVIGLSKPERCAHFVRADLSTADGIQEGRAALEAYMDGRTHEVLVNNAGGAAPAPAARATHEQVERDITLNLIAPMLLCAHAVAGMCETGRGSIVNIASTAARTGVAYLGPYSAAKAGLIAYTQSLAAEYAPHGLQINCVCPGAIDTEGARKGRQTLSELHGLSESESYPDGMAARTGTGGLLVPDDVANVVAWLLTRKARGVNGQAINVCGTLEMG